MLDIINPANEEIITQVEQDDTSSIKEKFENAKQAQSEWENVSLSKRMDIIREFSKNLQEQNDNLAETMTRETGKPISQSKNELQAMPARINFFLDNIEHAIESEKVYSDSKIEECITYEPLGVIANISAWNYPYFVGSNVFIPALLTGNAVLYKPSEYSTLTGLAIARLFEKAALPQNLFSVIVGRGETGQLLLQLPVNGVFFTGSYATGTKVAQAVSGRMIKTQFELGGKDPVYVFDDADIESAAASTWEGVYYHNGQSCCAIERLYIHEKIYDHFLEVFMQQFHDKSIGDPFSEKTFFGPLTRKAQIEVLEKQVNDALGKNAQLLRGGKRLSSKGYYFEPTVLINVNHSMEIMREESFGPIIGIQKVKSDEEAITLMNDTEYGLTSGVYGKDRKRAEKILLSLNSGTVYFNCCDRVSPYLPWTGRKNSGMGSTLSHIGIQTFVQPKAWHIRKS